MLNPILISVAPNGARKTKQDHGNLPVTPSEIAYEAKQCKELGASLLHLHVRDKKQGHSLDSDYYRSAIKAVKKEVKDDMIIQVTSEACNIYSPEEQIKMVEDLHPESVSIAVRELFADDKFTKEAGEFTHWMHKNDIHPQYIIYNTADLKKFYKLVKKGVIAGDKHFLLFVLGKYMSGELSSPDNLVPFMTELEKQADNQNVNWAVCAFGKMEASCMLAAALLGGHVRIGFENNLHLVDGTVAQYNSDLVNQFNLLLPIAKRPVANAEKGRRIIACK